MGRGTGAGMPARVLGERIGEAAHSLTVGEMPLHGHSLQMVSTQYMTNLTGTNDVTLYNWNAINTSQAGNDQAHENQQPSRGLRYAIFTGVLI
jgi:microcystin-dependent protein